MLSTLALVAATMLPPITIGVRAAPSIPRALVTQTLEEASAIWSTAGVTFVWEIADAVATERISLAAAPLQWRHSLCVTIDEETGPDRGSSMPIGWIVFDDTGAPMHDIHLSFANALALVRAAEGVGTVSRMTVMELRMRLSRTLGRALAHELGHYLLESKAHTPTGLMKASRSASEFIGPQRDSFAIDAALRSLVTAQLKLASSLARR